MPAYAIAIAVVFLGAGAALLRRDARGWERVAIEFEYNDLDYTKAPTIDNELEHQGSTRFASFIHSITQSGFVRDDGESLPAISNPLTEFASLLYAEMPSRASLVCQVPLPHITRDRVAVQDSQRSRRSPCCQ